VGITDVFIIGTRLSSVEQLCMLIKLRRGGRHLSNPAGMNFRFGWSCSSSLAGIWDISGWAGSKAGPMTGRGRGHRFILATVWCAIRALNRDVRVLLNN